MGPPKNILKPWLRGGWVIPPQGHADCAAAMEKVLDISRCLYDAALPGVCRDEMPRPLLRETCAPVPATRVDSEYRRYGSCPVCLATEPWAGRRRPQGTARRTPTDWARFLHEIAERHPGTERITLGRDNLHSPRPGTLYGALAPAAAPALRDRCEFVSPPQHGRGLHGAEVELHVLIRQGLPRRSASLAVLRAAVAAWQAARDRLRNQVNRPFTTDDARVRRKLSCPTFYK